MVTCSHYQCLQFITITKGSWTLIYMHDLRRNKIFEIFYNDTMLTLPIVHSLNFMVFEMCVDAHNDYNNVVILGMCVHLKGLRKYIYLTIVVAKWTRCAYGAHTSFQAKTCKLVTLAILSTTTKPSIFFHSLPIC